MQGSVADRHLQEAILVSLSEELSDQWHPSTFARPHFWHVWYREVIASGAYPSSGWLSPDLNGAHGAGRAGVVFQRDVLVSMGGQSYGSITEDFNTAMNLLSCGFATMYVLTSLSKQICMCQC